MSVSMRQLVLRANALYIGFFAISALVFDIRGVLYGLGPPGRVIAQAPYAAIGFIEAHGLACILAVLLWRAAPLRSWHVTGLAMSTLLGTANLAFWQLFIFIDALMLGYVTTALHWTFALLQLVAAISAKSGAASDSRLNVFKAARI